MLKKFFALIVIIFVSHSFMNAQGISLGIKAGSDLQKMPGYSFEDKYEYGYHLGGFVELKLNSTFSIQSELYYSTINLTVDSSGNNFASLYEIKNANKLKFGYINIPLLLNISANKFLGFQVGPRYGLLTNSNLSIKGQATNALKTGDLSMVAGLQIKVLNVRVYGRYQVGLNNISEVANAEKWKNQTIHVGVAISLL